MYDPLAIVALIISVASAIFVIITQGFDMLLGYRESSETAKRREEINSKLRAEVKEQEREVLRTITLEKNEEKELQTLVDLGQSAFYAKSITNRLLERMTERIGTAIGFVAMSLGTFLVTLFQGLNQNLSDIANLLPFLVFVALGFSMLYLAGRALRQYYLLRERFLRLGENPTLAYCKELSEELRKENVW